MSFTVMNIWFLRNRTEIPRRKTETTLILATSCCSILLVHESILRPFVFHIRVFKFIYLSAQLSAFYPFHKLCNVPSIWEGINFLKHFAFICTVSAVLLFCRNYMRDDEN